MATEVTTSNIQLIVRKEYLISQEYKLEVTVIHLQPLRFFS